ncbi:MAG: YhbY family RNA-binding protein [Methylococcales bacterium]|nr:YhbY family RNA-binding protein [Methylococcales bacterium]MCK5924536.1 YhbY family RNA-binding protein [Methylococcales bacterium]
MNPADKKSLKAKAHSLKPVVMIGQSGLSDSVLAEIKSALLTHELIKIKIRAERDQRKQMSAQICLKTHAELVQTIGQISIIYKSNPNK